MCVLYLYSNKDLESTQISAEVKKVYIFAMEYYSTII